MYKRQIYYLGKRVLHDYDHVGHYLRTAVILFRRVKTYFAGRAFGKHKHCPVVSPKKTVEGAIGGVLGTMVFGVIITLVYSCLLYTSRCV